MNPCFKIWPACLLCCISLSISCHAFTTHLVADRNAKSGAMGLDGLLPLSHTSLASRMPGHAHYNWRRRSLRIWADPTESEGGSQNITSSSDNTSEEDASSSIQENLSESTMSASVPNQALWQKYQVLQILYAAIAVVLFACPDRTMTKRLATKWGGAAGFGLAAGISYVLAGATQKQHLTKDTYKRLNIGLMGFAALGTFAVPGEAGFLRTMKPAIILSILCNATRLFGFVVAYMGLSSGILGNNIRFSFAGLKTMFQEVLRGSKATLRGLKVTKENKKKSLAYRNLLLFVLVGIVSSFMEGIFNLRYRVDLKKTLFDSSLQWSAVSRLFLISTMIFSLKDAADRDRLTATTFIQMNIMVGAWALLVGIGQGLSPSGFSGHRIEMFTFSLQFFIKGLKAQKERSDKQKLAIPPAS